MADLTNDRLITVCSSCLCASCWLGLFYCDDCKVAGTVKLPVSELRVLDREHSDYWKQERAYG